MSAVLLVSGPAGLGTFPGCQHPFAASGLPERARAELSNTNLHLSVTSSKLVLGYPGWFNQPMASVSKSSSRWPFLHPSLKTFTDKVCFSSSIFFSIAIWKAMTFSYISCVLLRKHKNLGGFFTFFWLFAGFFGFAFFVMVYVFVFVVCLNLYSFRS